MNITKDYYDYLLNTKNMNYRYSFKCERYSPIHKCNRLLLNINEVENSIDQLTIMSKKSSSFNDRHLKFTSASMEIKHALMDIEKEMKIIKNKDLLQPNLNNFEKKLINNCLDILNNKISDLTSKFQKFLQQQATTIKKVEQRKSNLSLSSRKSSNFNEYTINTNNNDDEDVLLNITGQQNIQTTMQNNSQYYQNRLNNVQSIEKTMGEISGMMNRLSQMTYEHSLMIDNISQNTDITLSNVEKGAKEVKGILENVKGNRGMLIRIFLVIIVVSVIYILFFA